MITSTRSRSQIKEKSKIASSAIQLKILNKNCMRMRVCVEY